MATSLWHLLPMPAAPVPHTVACHPQLWNDPKGKQPSQVKLLPRAVCGTIPHLAVTHNRAEKLGWPVIVSWCPCWLSLVTFDFPHTHTSVHPGTYFNYCRALFLILLQVKLFKTVKTSTVLTFSDLWLDRNTSFSLRTIHYLSDTPGTRINAIPWGSPMFNHNCMALHCTVYASFSASGKKIQIMMLLKDISVQMKSPAAAVSITIP